MSLTPEERKTKSGAGFEVNHEDQKKPDANDSKEQILVDLDSSIFQREEKVEFQQILDILNLLSNEVSSLSQTVENRLNYDATKEKAFDRLYAELDELKKNATFEQIRPLYMDLILLYDRIENTQYELSLSDSIPSTVINLFNSISDELIEILSRREIELIKNNTTSFDPVYQRAIGTQPTCLIDENNQVDRIVRRGFIFRDRVLRAEEVIVKKYTTIIPGEDVLKT